jgi:NAD(P)H-dependent FMN reductase
MKLFALSASLRAHSHNDTLLRLAVEIARANGATVDHAPFAAFDMPPFNEDLAHGETFPAGAQALRARLQAADGVMLASPEYNLSMPGHLKNALDWLSRYHPDPLRGRHVLLMSASPTLAGGHRGLLQLRVPLEGMGAFVFPEMVDLPQADEAFSPDGRLKNGLVHKRLAHVVTDYMRHARALMAAGFHPPAPAPQSGRP